MYSSKTYYRKSWFLTLREFLASDDDFARFQVLAFLMSGVSCGFISPNRSQSIRKILDRHLFLSEIPF